MTESIDVCKYIGANLDPNNRLYPPSERDRVDSFLQQWESVTDTYYSYLSASNKANVNSARTNFAKSLQKLEPYFPDNDGPFLLGEKFSIAECISAPWVQRFHHVIPHYRAETLNDIGVSGSISKWMEAVQKRSSVIDTGVPSGEMFRAAELYYVSYVSPGAPALKVTRT